MSLSIKRIAITAVGLVMLYAVSVPSLQGQTGTKVPPAQTLIDRALKAARAQNKTVFVHFGASWCTWCKQLDAMLQSHEVGKLIADHFVLVNLTVQESDNKKSTENPGAEKLMTDTGGGKTGVSYYLFLNKDGVKTGNSMVMPKDANIGYPATPDEIKTFGELMARVAPRMTGAERSRIIDYLTKHAPKDSVTSAH